MATTTSLDVSVTGDIDPRTGYVHRSRRAQAIVEREVVSKVDHSNFNLEVDFMRGIIPTTENIVVAMWRVLEPAVAPATADQARALGDAEQLRRVRGE